MERVRGREHERDQQDRAELADARPRPAGRCRTSSAAHRCHAGSGSASRSPSLPTPTRCRAARSRCRPPPGCRRGRRRARARAPNLRRRALAAGRGSGRTRSRSRRRRTTARARGSRGTSMKSSLSASPRTCGPMTMPSSSSITTTGGAIPRGSTATVSAARVAAKTMTRNESSSTPITPALVLTEACSRRRSRPYSFSETQGSPPLATGKQRSRRCPGRRIRHFRDHRRPGEGHDLPLALWAGAPWLLNCPIVGVAVDDWTADDLRQHARDAIQAGGESVDEETFDRFGAGSPIWGDFGDHSTFERVAAAVRDAQSPASSTSDSAVPVRRRLQGLAEAGLTDPRRPSSQRLERHVGDRQVQVATAAAAISEARTSPGRLGLLTGWRSD